MKKEKAEGPDDNGDNTIPIKEVLTVDKLVCDEVVRTDFLVVMERLLRDTEV